MLPEFPLYSPMQVVTSALQSAIATLTLSSLLPSDSIPIQRQPNTVGIVYKSPIAFRLTTLCHQTLTEIATLIVAHLQEPSGNLEDFAVELVPPGWIYCHWNNLAISRWLESLMYLRHRGSSKHTNQLVGIYPLHYTRARCRSLLRLAATQGWVTLAPSGEENVVFPKPIPWFDERGCWQLGEPLEARAIASLIDLLDTLLNQSQNYLPHSFKVAMKLAESFWEFEAQFQIFRNIDDNERQLLTCRIALVAAVESSLSLAIDRLLNAAPQKEI